MIARISPSPLSGAVKIPCSKSDTHRALIAAALCESPTELNLSGVSEDISATVRCLEAFGAKISTVSEERRYIEPVSRLGAATSPLLDCGESGTTLRLLLPVAAALGAGARFTGHGRLPERPLDALIAAMESNGCRFSGHTLPFSVSGKLKSGTFSLPGNISSQYISGLLFAFALADGDSRIELTTKLESAAYVDMTLKTLGDFGIRASQVSGGYTVPGGQKYASPGAYTVEGDWSNAAFFMAAGALGDSVTVTGLAHDSLQGDRAFCDILRRFGATVMQTEAAVTVSGGDLRGIDIDVSEVPDLFPVLAVVAAGSAGTTRLLNAARLRIKESDRIHAVSEMLKNLGADVTELSDSLIVQGKKPLSGGIADGKNDHRIVMAAAVASILCRDTVTITGAEAVNKSYPQFFSDFNMLGGNSDVISTGQEN